MTEPTTQETVIQRCPARPGDDHRSGPAPSGPAKETTGTIRYEVAEGIAKITICRPRSATPFRPQTLFELTDAFNRARTTPPSGRSSSPVRVPTRSARAATRKIRGDDGYIGDDDVARAGIGRLNVLDLQIQIRRLPQAGGRHGGGLRHRRGPHPPPGVRPHHRGGQRPLRPDRADRRELRRWVRFELAGAHHRAQACEGGLVPLPPVRRQPGTRLGPGQRRGPLASSRPRPSRGAAAC